MVRLALVLPLALGACVALRSPQSVFQLSLQAEFVGTGRNHGHIADAAFRNDGSEAVRAEIPAGTVLDPGTGKHQKMVVWESVVFRLGPGRTIRLLLEGACLEPERPPWPRGRHLRQARLVTLEAWATKEGQRDPRRLVGVLAVSGDRFEKAKQSPRYEAPPVDDADETVRYWALMATVAGKTKEDLAGAVAREEPEMDARKRAERADQVWAAVAVVVEEGGKKAAEEQGIDWAGLDFAAK